jgi:hypothetical protein
MRQYESESEGSAIDGWLHNVQVWKQRTAPLLWEHLATSMDSVETYTLFYHEAALTNLLEVLFHLDC